MRRAHLRSAHPDANALVIGVVREHVASCPAAPATSQRLNESVSQRHLPVRESIGSRRGRLSGSHVGRLRRRRVFSKSPTTRAGHISDPACNCAGYPRTAQLGYPYCVFGARYWGAFCSVSGAVASASRHLARCSELGEESGGAFGESGTAVFGRSCRSSSCEVAGAFEIAVGAAGNAEVSVVELPAGGFERCLQPGVDVVRSREPLFGLFVVTEDCGRSGKRARYGTAHEDCRRRDDMASEGRDPLDECAGGAMISRRRGNIEQITHRSKPGHVVREIEAGRGLGDEALAGFVDASELAEQFRHCGA